MKKTAVKNEGENLKKKLLLTIASAIMALVMYITGIVLLGERELDDKITEPSTQSVTIVDLPNQQST
ncbi:MAG: hypothetical protein J6C53_01945 [Clostridia bacterium]|nr:hypothetical protein [Clostridia bacterium]